MPYTASGVTEFALRKRVARYIFHAMDTSKKTAPTFEHWYGSLHPEDQKQVTKQLARLLPRATEVVCLLLHESKRLSAKPVKKS